MKDDIYYAICNGNGDILNLLDDFFASNESKMQYLKLLKIYYSARLKRGMLISDVAKLASVTPLTIKRIENLQSVPNISTFLDMLRAVGIDFDFFVIDDNSKVNRLF